MGLVDAIVGGELVVAALAGGVAATWCYVRSNRREFREIEAQLGEHWSRQPVATAPVEPSPGPADPDDENPTGDPLGNLPALRALMNPEEPPVVGGFGGRGHTVEMAVWWPANPTPTAVEHRDVLGSCTRDWLPDTGEYHTVFWRERDVKTAGSDTGEFEAVRTP